MIIAGNRLGPAVAASSSTSAAVSESASVPLQLQLELRVGHHSLLGIEQLPWEADIIWDASALAGRANHSHAHADLRPRLADAHECEGDENEDGEAPSDTGMHTDLPYRRAAVDLGDK